MQGRDSGTVIICSFRRSKITYLSREQIRTRRLKEIASRSIQNQSATGAAFRVLMTCRQTNINHQHPRGFHRRNDLQNSWLVPPPLKPGRGERVCDGEKEYLNTRLGITLFEKTI
jgi:hypothetical protein